MSGSTARGWRGRIGRGLEVPGLLLAGLGGPGALALAAAGAHELVGTGEARALLAAAPAGLALGALAGALLGGPAAAAVARLLGLVAAAAPALVVALGPGDSRLGRPGTWVALTVLACLAAGLALGASRRSTAAALATVLTGGALGAALVPWLAAGPTAPGLAPLLALAAVAGVAGQVSLGLGAWLARAGAVGAAGAEVPGPADDWLAPHHVQAADPAAEHPRHVGTALLAGALLGALALGRLGLWAALAPTAGAGGPGDPVLLAVVLAGLALGARLLGGLLARGGLAGPAGALGLGLAWALVPALGVPGAAAGLAPGLLAPPDPAPLARALDLALVIGPLLLALGALPVALEGRLPLLAGSRRVALAAWLLPVGVLAHPLVGFLATGGGTGPLAACLGVLALLAFLDADRLVPRLGAVRGPLGRVLGACGRGLGLALVLLGVALAVRTPDVGPLARWHAPAEVLALVPGPEPRLELRDALTAARRTHRPGGAAEPADLVEARVGLALDLLARLELPPGPVRLPDGSRRSPGVADAAGLDPTDGPPVAHVVSVTRAAAEVLTTEDLAAALAALPEGGLLVLLPPPDLAPDAFVRTLDTVAGAVPAASLWFLGGEPLLLAGRAHPTPVLDELDPGLATLAAFVGPLAPTGTDRRARLDLRPSPSPPPLAAAAERRRARNLEQTLARAGPLPAAWGPLVAPLLAPDGGPPQAHPALRAGRHLREAHLAHAWLGHHALAAPGSLALETWSARLDDALAAALVEVPGQPEALALFDLAEAEAGARRGLELLREGEATRAIPFLIRSTQRWPERGDLALGLALALDRAGNRSAAEVVVRDLGADRGALLETPAGRELVELGLDPALVGEPR